jgi:hypothetical protein
MGQGVSEPAQERVTRVNEAALVGFGSPFRQLTLTIGQWRPTEQVICLLLILLAPLLVLAVVFFFVDNKSCLAGLCAFLHLWRSWRLWSVAPRRASAIAAAALCPRSDFYRRCKQSSTRAIAGTTMARTGPVIIRAAMSGTMVLAAAPLSSARRSGAIIATASSLRIPGR